MTVTLASPDWRFVNGRPSPQPVDRPGQAPNQARATGSARSGEVHVHAQPGLVVVERDRPAVRRDDPASYREAQPGAGAGTARIHSMEPLEHLVPLLGRDARAAVRHVQEDAVRARLAAGLDGLALGRELDRVVEEDHE